MNCELTIEQSSKVEVTQEDREFAKQLYQPGDTLGRQLTIQNMAARHRLLGEHAARGEVEQWRDLVGKLLDAEQAVENEAARAEREGKGTWSSAPVVRRCFAMQDLQDFHGLTKETTNE